MRPSRASLSLGLALAACFIGCGNSNTTTGASTGSGGGATGSGSGGATTSSSTGTGGATTTSSGTGGSDGGTVVASTRVFVTSKTYQGGTLGGLAGADAECQKLAVAASLGGTWMAWLSDGGTITPVTRFAHSTMPYVLVGGAQIAANWNDLLDGTISVPIDHDETGSALPASGTTRVWTGTTAVGAPMGPSCQAWTMVGSGGVYGSTAGTDATWSFVSGNTCDNTDRLYCFEQ
jgi:hypothetical protein